MRSTGPIRPAPPRLCQTDRRVCRGRSSPRQEGLRSSSTAGAACGTDDVPSAAQLLKEVGRSVELIHLHIAVPQLADAVRVRSGRSDLAQVLRQRRRGAIRARLAPWVVRLDDVNAIGQLDDSRRAVMRTLAVERMRKV